MSVENPINTIINFKPLIIKECHFFQVKRINNLLTEIGLGAKIDKRHRVVETRLTKMITVIVYSGPGPGAET